MRENNEIEYKIITFIKIPKTEYTNSTEGVLGNLEFNLENLKKRMPTHNELTNKNKKRPSANVASVNNIITPFLRIDSYSLYLYGINK